MKPYSERYLEKLIYPMDFNEVRRYGEYCRLEATYEHSRNENRQKALDELKQMAKQDEI